MKNSKLMNKNDKIYVAINKGIFGNALVKNLQKKEKF